MTPLPPLPAVLLLSMTLLPGCVTVQYNYTPEKVQFSLPEPGAAGTAAPGEAVLERGTLTRMHSLRIPHDITGIFYRIPAGSYAMIGSDSRRLFFEPSRTSMTSTLKVLSGFAVGMCQASLAYQGYDAAGRETLCGSGGGDAPQALYVSARDEPGRVCVINYDQESYCYGGEFEVQESLQAMDDDFGQQLLYSGVQDSELRLTYLETVGGRSVFQHEVIYDAGDDSEISYRGARLKITAPPSGRGLTYEVLSGF